VSLIECPECKKEVSDTVDNCIHCGFTLSKAVEVNQSQTNNETLAEGAGVESTMNGLHIWSNVPIPYLQHVH